MIQEDDAQNDFTQRRNGQDGVHWTRKQKMTSKKTVMKKKGEVQNEDMETIQKSVQEAAKKVAHTTKSDGDQGGRRTPEKVRVKEGSTARCTQAIKRKVLRKQARKTRADHAVKCSMMLGKRKPKRKPLTELYVDGNFTEDSEEWNKELQRHCDCLYTDLEETKEVQEERIEYFKRGEGDQHFTKNGREPEIAVDLIL